MNWKRLWAVARKEAIQIRRDPRSLVIVLIMPLILVLLFGYGVSLDLKHLPIYVYDREGSQQSQDLLKRFQASEYFHVVRAVNSYPELIRGLDRGDAKMGIVIPWNFSQRIRNGETVPIQALVDATDDNTANILIGYTQAVVQGYSMTILSDWSQRLGRGVPLPPISIEARTWFNEDLESRAFILPGVLALVMAVIGAFLTSLTIAREWERGTMEQLISTPVTALEILFGKLAPYFVMGMLAAIICALVAKFPHTAGQHCAISCRRAFHRIFCFGGREESARRQPDGVDDRLPTFVPALRIPVFHRADAAAHSNRHPHRSRALLHDNPQRHFSEGHACGDVVWRAYSLGDFRGRAGAHRYPRFPQTAGMRRLCSDD
jgi:hypothetical protein